MTTDIATRIRNLPLTAELADDTLILEVDLGGSADQLWRAVTDPEVLQRWSPIVPERPLTSVGPALSRETPEADPVAADVLAIADGRALTHRWGDDIIEWAIEDGRVVVQMRLVQPELAAMSAAGWQVCLGVLDALLDGEDQARILGMDAMAYGWAELNEAHAEQLGLEARMPE